MLLNSVRRGTRYLHTSHARLAVQTVNVPNMGDSISEGTVAELVKQAGESVQADEVVAILDTDKVSVDVMSPVAGTVVEHFSSVDDNVEVGKALFTVDDSNAPASAASTPTKPSPSPPAKEENSEPVKKEKPEGAYKPLIQFLGKRSLLPSKPSPLSQPRQSEAPSQAPQTQPSSPDVLPFTHTKKPAISKEEVEAINSGFFML